MHCQISTPNMHSTRSSRLEFLFLKVVVVFEDTKGLLFVDICRSYALCDNKLGHHFGNPMMILTSSQQDLKEGIFVNTGRQNDHEEIKRTDTDVHHDQV